MEILRVVPTEQLSNIGMGDVGQCRPQCEEFAEPLLSLAQLFALEVPYD